jgi:hypothetical protein
MDETCVDVRKEMKDLNKHCKKTIKAFKNMRWVPTDEPNKKCLRESKLLVLSPELEKLLNTKFSDGNMLEQPVSINSAITGENTITLGVES